jgi:hypothetical protein
MHPSNRIISIGAFFLLLAWAPLRAASPQQITWQCLPVLTGKNVSLVMPGGALISGKLAAVDAEALTVNVARTTDPGAYPKGEVRVPRASLRTLQVQTKGRKFRVIGTFFGANAGIAGGYQAAIGIQGSVLSPKHRAAAAAAFIGIATGGAVAGYLVGNRADRRSAIYEILPQPATPAAQCGIADTPRATELRRRTGGH